MRLHLLGSDENELVRELFWSGFWIDSEFADDFSGKWILRAVSSRGNRFIMFMVNVMKTRTMSLGFIIQQNVEYLEESLARCARKASVQIEVVKQERKRTFEGHGPYPLPPATVYGFDLQVTVKGENSGSVEDYCDFYLASMVRDVIIRLDVEFANYAYIDRIMCWLKSHKEVKC